MRRRGISPPEGIPLGRAMNDVARFVEWLDWRLSVRDAQHQTLEEAERVIAELDEYDVERTRLVPRGGKPTTEAPKEEP